VLGQAVAGPLAGTQLTPIVHGDHFWFSWAAFKPDTIIYALDSQESLPCVYVPEPQPK
jgi:hypothetical protein